MFPHLAQFTDFSLLFLRFMVGLIFTNSGYDDLKNPDTRAKSISTSKRFAIFLGVAEVLGGIAVIVGVLTQLAAIGLILVMLGATQKKIFVWKTGFWGTTSSPGWYYELTFISILLVILCTDGGRLVLLR